MSVLLTLEDERQDPLVLMGRIRTWVDEAPESEYEKIMEILHDASTGDFNTLTPMRIQFMANAAYVALQMLDIFDTHRRQMTAINTN